LAESLRDSEPATADCVPADDQGFFLNIGNQILTNRDRRIVPLRESGVAVSSNESGCRKAAWRCGEELATVLAVYFFVSPQQVRMASSTL
jgi:hypothetical protein